MRELTSRECDFAAGGKAQEYRTIIVHEIPRFDHIPANWVNLPGNSEEEPEQRAPGPIPLRWLPPQGDVPQVQ